MGSKKPKNPDKLLEKAEKLFEKASYPAAKKEFEKANKLLKRDDITEKIALCDREIRREKAQELIKKGKKSIGKKMLKEALRCFEEAHEITGETWLLEKIETLKSEVSDKDLVLDARDAENRKDYSFAADLYFQAYQNLKEEKWLLRRAHCLVMNSEYQKAAEIYNSFSELDNRSLYDFGFASAKTGRFYECLTAWERISSTNSEFEAQKELIRDAMAARLQINDNIPVASLYEQCRYLGNHGYRETMGSFFDRVKQLFIKELWKQERYPEIHEMIQPWPDSIPVSTLRFYTRLYFRLAYDSSEYIEYLPIFWLTGIYNPEVYPEAETEAVEPEAVFHEFVQAGENLIKQYLDSGVEHAGMVLNVWNAQKVLMPRIHKLMTNLNKDSMLICSPQFAFRFGLAETICQIIRNHKNHFDTASDYLETGAYYCAFGEGLIQLNQKNYKTAFESVQNHTSGEHEEFETYCRNRIHFEYGLYCIENKIAPPPGIFKAAADLFKQAPELEALFDEKALEAHEYKDIQYFETALKEIVDHHPSTRMKNTLSYLMVLGSLKQYNRHRLTARAFETVLIKALKLNEDNELAKDTLSNIRKELEIETLVNAIDKFKFNKAAKIAANTEYEDVSDVFFDFLEEQYIQLKEADIAPERKIRLLNELGKWGSRADETHPLLEDICESLEQLQQG